ncbi:MAG: hypothetical protein J6K89_05800 [Oscillospiraceae bacterium]|nr:hypothetical protein [Oscillospiraceae bacterium]
MIVYSVMMLVIFAILIMKGNASLINCYREERVKDRAAYCTKMGQALLIMAFSTTVSGVVSLFSGEKPVIFTALIVTLVGVSIGIVRIFHVQKKYGGGVF